MSQRRKINLSVQKLDFIQFTILTSIKPATGLGLQSQNANAFFVQKVCFVWFCFFFPLILCPYKFGVRIRHPQLRYSLIRLGLIENKKLKNQPGLKYFNLNFVFTDNIDGTQNHLYVNAIPSYSNETGSNQHISL